MTAVGNEGNARKTAVVTITRPGLVVAGNIARECQADLYVSERYVPNIPEDLRSEAHPFDAVSNNPCSSDLRSIDPKARMLLG